MRLALFSEVIPPIQDGVCHAMTNLSASLDEERIPYEVVSGIAPAPDLSWRDSVHKVRSIPFPGYGYYRMSVPFAPRLDAALDRFRPQILHAANPTLLGLYALSYGRRRNIPVVTSYHTHYVSYFPYYGLGKLRGLGWWLLRWFHSRCRATYVPSPSARRELETRGIPRVDLWQRGVNRDRFSPRFRREELRRSVGANGIPMLLYVGRLVKEKDLADLAGAVTRLKDQGQRFRTVIVGDGPMREELKERLPDAHFTGYLAGRELSEWYASADFFVFPSTTETFGNVILEAFASGLPVIGVEAGGSVDLVAPGRNGLLARRNDPVDLAEKIRCLLAGRDDLQAMRSGALRTARRYDWGEINRRLITDYERVIREHRRPATDPALELAAG